MEEYFIVTFDEYDDLEEKAMAAFVPKDYEEPSRHQVRLMERDTHTLYLLLVALHHTKDRDYVRFLNQFLTTTVKFVETKEEKELLKKELAKTVEENQEHAEQLKFTATKETLNHIKTLLGRIKFTPIEYYPSQEDIQKLIKRYYKDDKESVIAYLFWLFFSDIELSEEEMKTKEYIRKALSQLILEVEEEV